MEHQNQLTFTPINHPDPQVAQVGFDLSDPYVEQCWAPVVGPSATLLLRRLPTMWADQVPAAINHSDMARSLGLGLGTGPNSRLNNTLDRVARFGLASWHVVGQSLNVHMQVPGLSERQLERLPDWSRSAHERLLDAHVKRLGGQSDLSPQVTAMTARLDRLERPNPAPAKLPAWPAPALGS